MRHIVILVWGTICWIIHGFLLFSTVPWTVEAVSIQPNVPANTQTSTVTGLYNDTTPTTRPVTTPTTTPITTPVITSPYPGTAMTSTTPTTTTPTPPPTQKPDRSKSWVIPHGQSFMWEYDNRSKTAESSLGHRLWILHFIAPDKVYLPLPHYTLKCTTIGAQFLNRGYRLGRNICGIDTGL